MSVSRRGLAVLALASLAGLILSMPAPGFPGQTDLRPSFFPLLVPLVVTAVGIVTGRPWGRWLALASAIGVLPWALALVSGPSYGVPQTRPWLALGASLGLLMSLSGPKAFDDFEGRSDRTHWRGRRMALVRWTVICNVAAILNLYVFATAYTPAVAWQSAIPGALALGLVLGSWFLARGRTLGLLLLTPCCLLLPPAAFYFVMQQAVTGAERILFAVLLAPGWLTALATLIGFAGPIRRFVRD